MVDSRLSRADSLGHQLPSYVHPAEEWDPESGVPPPARKPGEATWDYSARCGWLARNEAERLGYFDAPEARADQRRADRRAREALLGAVPRHPTVGRRHPISIQRRRGHRERRPGASRVARRRSSAASRDGPDDLDPPPSPAAAVAASVIAAAGIHHTFAELRFLLAPRFSPAEGLQVFSLLPSEAEEEAWAQ
jgi:hypothetical protein